MPQVELADLQVPVRMSAPSLNEGTLYGSCVNSDAESLLSQQTFRTVKSDSSRSTNFFSGDSDTDTLVCLSLFCPCMTSL